MGKYFFKQVFLSFVVVLLNVHLYAKNVDSNNVTENSLTTPVVVPSSQSLSLSSTLIRDSGDYYFLNTGKKKNYFRKKDYYLLIQNKNIFSATEMTDQIKSNFGGQFEVIHEHSFDGHTMVKALGVSGNTTAHSMNLQNSVSGVEYVSPVFTTGKGSGDMALVPRIVVKLMPMIKPARILSEKSLGVNLVLSSTLVDAHQEFEFQIKSPIKAGDIFSLARKIMALPYVKWAEPEMLASPVSLFTPNDPLFVNQWHLHNTGQNGGKIDADIDAPEGWELSKGDGTVIAIFDDGVEVNHPDFSIWTNPGESGGGKESNGIDDDGNGFVDDFQGWDFADSDNNPSPSSNAANHGTAVAGVAAAKGNNALGVTGSAINADILPIKSGNMYCSDWGNAMRYAGKYSDVVNNSWSIGTCESSLNSAINDVVSGNIAGARRGTKGTPVLFATGNAAGGWFRFSLSGFTAGSTHTFRWEYSKDASISQGSDTVWLDSITWPGGATSNFDIAPLSPEFTSSGNASWTLVNDGVHARGASGHSVKAGVITDNQVTQLNVTKTVGSGTLYYWAWVSSQLNGDYLKFYLDGVLHHQFSPGQYTGHFNEVGYPASNVDTIAIGGSQDGGPEATEERTFYSQFGPEVDVIAPTSGGFQGISTTDRTGSVGYGSGDYINSFGGTSSATPLTSGVVADIIAYNPALTALQVRTILWNGADKIGPYGYPGGRNDFYGHGRVNLLQSLQLASIGSQNAVVKRAEIAKAILQKKYGAAYVPPLATGAVYTDVQAGDFNADWVEKLANDQLAEGCALNKFCPQMPVTKEQLAKILLKAKYGSVYTPTAATGLIFSDISISSFAANWIEDLSNKNFSEGCSASKYCPKDAVTFEMFEKILNKVFL